MTKTIAVVASLVIAASVGAMTACGGQADTGAPRADTSGKQTTLTIRVMTVDSRRTYRLHCDPPGGSAPKPNQLCASLAAHAGTTLFATNPPCYGSKHIYVRGEYQGKLVKDHDLCGGPSPADWWAILLSPSSA